MVVQPLLGLLPRLGKQANEQLVQRLRNARAGPCDRSGDADIAPL